MDKILRTLICGGQVSLAVIETTELVNSAVEIHKIPCSAARILGGLLTCGAYLASSLKEDGASVSLTVKAKNGDGAVSVSADKNLHIRGYADGSCESTLAGGSLTVVREDGRSQPFVGTCEIFADGISDILDTYFGQSEQIATASSINVLFGEDGKCVSAGGIVMQLLPCADEDNIVLAGTLFEEFKSNFSDKKFDAQTVINTFNAYFSGALTTAFPVYKCNCSERKIRGVLASLGKRELLKICDELGEVKVHCHYCNKDYTYNKTRIEEIF